MKILLVGGGGREHALAMAISASPLCEKLYCAPGNAGIAAEAECVDIAAEDIEGLCGFAKSNGVDFAVIGPEAPLVAGVADQLTRIGVKVFGPSAAAARLEGSKGFAKDLCAKYNIPTAGYGRFDEPDGAYEFIRTHGAPIVVKADGLAAGKGVIVAHNTNEAYAAVDHIMVEDSLAGAGAEVVIEEFLEGEEVSFFALADGARALPLIGAQDHKRAFDGDEGPNTGGMGAYSPAPVLDDAMAAQVMDEIITPTVNAMTREGAPFKGVLFAGLMITAGGPRLIEYNVRFGDPECQVLMARLTSDLLPALVACADGDVSGVELNWSNESALLVVMASDGYPGGYRKGDNVNKVDEVNALDNVMVYHAGTARNDGRLVNSGGRVLGVTGCGATLAEARKRAYAACETIDWDGGFYRKDIGWRALKSRP